MKHQFKAKIYSIGINWAVDVPTQVTEELVREKGYIRIKGQINGFEFIQTLVPVKNKPYRLFVNLIMMKGGKTEVGKTASFTIAQNNTPIDKIYNIPPLLSKLLLHHGQEAQFEQLSPYRKKDILKYLCNLKTEETMYKNVMKVIDQLKQKESQVRIP
ncbi:MAG: DUF1905 domain-containing protein [Pedobacter sp.]|nr:DUF1905 domain-containing protein [Pedobacter sp.]